MAKRTTRKQSVLQERAEEFNYEERMRGNPLGLRSGGYDMYQQQEEEAERDCRRYAHLAECCEMWHDLHPLRKVTLLNGEVIRVCHPIERAIRPAYYAERYRLWFAERMNTADGRRYLATMWLSFSDDQQVMFALEAWNETAPEGEKVDFITTLQKREPHSKRPGRIP